MICDVGIWRAGGKTSPISRDGQLVSSFGDRNGIPSVVAGLEELCAGLIEGEGGTLGEVDRLDVISQSIRLRMVNYAWI